MKTMKKTVYDVDVSGKRVLVRADFNVPLKNGDVADDTRIRKTLPTIRYLMEQGARTILCSHMGRPEGKIVEALRLNPVRDRLSDLLDKKVIKLDVAVGGEAERAAGKLCDGDVLLLENTRFHPGEKENDSVFSRNLAMIADAYVNDAFAAAHRAHASTEGVAHYLPSAAGLLMAEEIKALENVLEAPEKPLIAIFGGAKIRDKIQVIARLLDELDAVLTGGAMANTLLNARGATVGASKTADDHLETARKILNKAGDRLCLPVDVVAAEQFDENAKIKIVEINDIPEGWHIMDIGPETIAFYKNKLKNAGMTVWNGPLGVSELKPFSEGTRALIQCLAEHDAATVIGGGDTTAAVADAGAAEEMTHVSTGGGAFLKFIGGKELPGIAVLPDR